MGLIVIDRRQSTKESKGVGDRDIVKYDDVTAVIRWCYGLALWVSLSRILRMQGELVGIFAFAIYKEAWPA